MPNRSGRAAAKRAKMRDPRAKQRRNPKGGIGALPEWDLSDLYAGVSSPEIARDLARADALCLAFEERCKGKLAALARSPDRKSTRLNSSHMSISYAVFCLKKKKKKKYNLHSPTKKKKQKKKE